MIRGQTSIGVRFFLALFVLLVLGILAFGLIVARRAGDEVVDRSQRVLDGSGAELKGVFMGIADTQADLMEESVSSLSQNFGSELADIPFDLYEGRPEALEELLLERLEGMRSRTRDNSQVIAELFRREEGEAVERQFAAISKEQDASIISWRRDITKRLLIWGGFFLLAVSGLIGFAFFVTVLRPLRGATEVIEEMGEGDLTQRIPVAGGDEIARLATSFNAMADAVEGAQQGLSDKVSEKTSALRIALAEQEETNARLEGTLSKLETTQAMLVDSAKMAALGRMAEGMAHEFNNIIGGIRGCAAELHEDIDDPEAKDMLDIIVRTAERAGLVTENLLSFSRGVEGELSPVSIYEVARSAMRLVEPDAGRRGVQLELSGSPMPAITSDARGLQQVFLNLIINAVQASSEGDVVTLKVAETAEGQELRVEDRGAGIERDDLRRIFDPFFTTKDGSSASGGGSGLGLSVSHGIVSRLGGRIEAESDGPGQGARFRVEIPRREDG